MFLLSILIGDECAQLCCDHGLPRMCWNIELMCVGGETLVTMHAKSDGGDSRPDIPTKPQPHEKRSESTGLPAHRRRHQDQAQYRGGGGGYFVCPREDTD